MTKNLIAIALLATAGLALTACGKGGEKPAAEHEPAAAEHTPEHSSAGLPTGNIESGEKLATSKGCVGCHGAEGNAPQEGYPKLGGQYGDYIAHSLQGYRDGRREHQLMSPAAAGLTDQEISDLSAYFASRPSQLRDLEDTTL
jgi:cytochrome c553